MKKNAYFLRISKFCSNFVRFFDGGAFWAHTNRRSINMKAMV